MTELRSIVTSFMRFESVRSKLLQSSAPQLISAPDVLLPTRGWYMAEADAALPWLLGGHGGAGVSALRRAGVEALDAQGAWPQYLDEAGELALYAQPFVVVVVRSSTAGLEAARDAARQHAAGAVPYGTVLGGLVVVADAPGPRPRRIQNLLELVSGAYPRVREVPWLDEWRLASRSEPLPIPPGLQDLAHELQALACLSADPSR